MEKVLIVGCKRAMDDVCIGCSRCFVGFNRREGDFAQYKDEPDAQIMGLLSCGDCPGATIVTRLAQVKLWNPNGRKADQGPRRPLYCGSLSLCGNHYRQDQGQGRSTGD